MLSSRSAWLGACFALLLGWALTVVGPAWVYSPMGIDTWLYHGYFLNLRHHVPAFAGTYYGSRLAWILPGALVYSLFKALTANLVLRLFLLTVSILAVFWQVQRRHGTRVSFLISLLACGCPTLLSAIGWDYVDGPVIAYGLWCVEELDAALCLFENDRRYWHRLIFAGAAFGCALHSNIVFVVFAPLALRWIVPLRAQIWKALSCLAVGFVGLTGVLGVVNWMLGGDPLFFRPTLWFLVGQAGEPNRFRHEIGVWLPHATWLILPGLLSAAAIMVVVLWQQKRASASMVSDASLLPAAFALLGILQAAGGHMLEYSFYGDYLLVFVPLSLGALFSSVGLTGLLDRMKRPAYASVAILAIGVALIPSLAPSLAGDSSSARQSFVSVHESASRLIDRTKPSSLWFWYSVERDSDGYYGSVSSTFLWEYRLLNKVLPDAKGAKETLGAGAYLALMDRDPATMAAGLKALENEGVSFTTPENLGDAAHPITLIRIVHSDRPASIAYPITGNIGSENTTLLDSSELEPLAPWLRFGSRIPLLAPTPTPRDHGPTAYFALPTNTTGLAVEALTPTDASFLIQDQQFRILYQSGNVHEGRLEARFAIAPGTRAVRAVFNSQPYPSRFKLTAFR